MIDTHKLRYTGRYGIATGGAVSDHVLLSVAADFDNQVMRKIEALSPADLATRYAGADQVLVTHKYDGESTFIYFEQGRDAFCFSANSGRVRLGFAALDALQAGLIKAGVQKCLLRAEITLPAPAGDQRRLGVSEVIRVSFTGQEAEVAQLQIVLLDAVMLDGKDLRSNQSDFGQTLTLLQKLAGSDPCAPAFAMSAEIMSESAIPAAFRKIVDAGGEGIVVRRLNRFEARKVKPHRTVDAVIIGFVEDEFEGKYGVASLLTALVYPQEGADHFLQTFVRVGSGLTDEQRIQMLDQLRPLALPAPLSMTDSSGRTIHFVKPLLTCELHGEDLIASDAGRELRTQLLRWNESSGNFEFIGLSACPRLSFARFACLRADKVWHQGGARIEQVANLARPTPYVGDRSLKVIRREVYAKGEMLRKLVVVEKADPQLPFPYLIYWTDFSAKRAEPLKVSLQVASKLERATAIAEQLLADELTKGFVKLS